MSDYHSQYLAGGLRSHGGTCLGCGCGTLHYLRIGLMHLLMCDDCARQLNKRQHELERAIHEVLAA
jgi:hypothetical protein